MASSSRSSFLLICLAFILSSSVTWATVDLALNQDGPPLCGGRMVNFKCSTTTMGGSLRWDVNSVQMFLISSSASVGQNLTTNGNTFVFTEAATVPGVTVNVYTSTAELIPTTPTITVLCSDGGVPESRTLNIDNDLYSPINLRDTNVNGSNVQFEWDTPINAGVCCNQYRVVTSKGTTVTSETSFTMYNVSRDNASISVSCVDMLGTSGREVVFTPNITSQPVDVSIPEPVDDNICGSNVTYRVDLTILDLGRRFSEIVSYSISITDDDGRSMRESVVERSARSVTFILSNRTSFTATFTFTDEMGNSMTRSSSYDTTAINAACQRDGDGVTWHVPTLLAITIGVTVAKITTVSGLSVWIHKLRKRDGTVQQELEDKGSLKTDTKM